MSPFARYLSSVLFLAAGATVFAASGRQIETQNTSLAAPIEVAPDTIAIRGCIEGVAHPSGERLGFHAQLEACDALEALGDFGTLPRRYRAELLLDEGLTEAHMARALQDLDVLVAEAPTPWTLSRRAQIRANPFMQFEGALDDINAAIALRDDGPLPGDLAIRAILLMSIDYRDETNVNIAAATRDLEALERLDPDNHNIARIRAWIETYLREDAARNGLTVVPG